ncbi:MAG: hypothetical protein K0R36_667 [Chryseobacterium sp.]|jgi:hypothetical protein|nr:hypothetical protein [Chryseobacterium sp.]
MQSENPIFTDYIMINIVGGTYYEICHDPKYEDLFGSGLRGAIALSDKGFDINYHSSIGEDLKELFDYKASLYSISQNLQLQEKSTVFDYYHPLAKPTPYNLPDKNFILPDVKAKHILYYGMIESDCSVDGEYVVYDPQNHVGFRQTNSKAQHLALILNKKEAMMLSKNMSDDINEVGRFLLKNEEAEVVVIKNGANGATVFFENQAKVIPVFETELVWPIGSGDIFSAVFAWKWMIEKLSPDESAMFASKYTANYCSSKDIPLSGVPKEFKSIAPGKRKKIYLAGPFFTISERFLINEIHSILMGFDVDVFSPYHDAGIVVFKEDSKNIAKKDIDNLKDCDAVLAIISSNDPGTIFEVGYAKALEKKVVLFCENYKENDLFMFEGTDCEIISDLSTAIYKVSW